PKPPRNFQYHFRQFRPPGREQCLRPVLTVEAARMALFDLPLEALWEYRPQLSEPEDLMPFWEGTLSQAREASSPLLALERVDNGLTLIDTWDVTFAGHDGSPVRAWYNRPARAEADLPVVVEYLGYGGGRGEPLERLAFSTAGSGALDNA